MTKSEYPMPTTAEETKPITYSQNPSHVSKECKLRFRGIQANEKPFAGRIGGNGEFAVDADDSDVQSLLKRQPDAAQITSLRSLLSLEGFLQIDIYKSAILECIGTTLLIYSVSGVSSGLTTLPNITAQTAAAYGALTNWLGLTLFVYAFAPASGGHLNPSISIATFLTGLSTLPRTVLYVAAQCTGAIIAGYWLKLGLGADNYFPLGVIPGCTVDPSLVSRGQLFVLEFMYSSVLIFTAFGVGLDPRNARAYGPAYAPVLVGITLGFGTLISAFVKPGYTGVSFNSARCLGLMTAKGDLQWHWIHWLGTVSACIINGLGYHFIPPYRKDTGKPFREPPSLDREPSAMSQA